MSALSHLSPEARVLAQAHDAERLAFLATDRWIDYPRARRALEVLERLAAMPERTRMPGLLIHGESNIGKSMIVRSSCAATRRALTTTATASSAST